MGNIETLKRQNSTGTYDMDDISYHYDGAAPSWKNQLLYVDDSKAAALSTKDIDDQSAGNYAYDAIGNLIQDNAEEIQTIAWTVYGKIKSITRTGASTKPNLEFEYNTTGQRVIKRILPNNGDKPVTTFYLRDASGNIMATYKQYLKIIDIPTQAAEERLAVEEWNMYGSSRLGVLSKEELIASRVGVWNGSTFVPGNPATYTINSLPTTDIFDEQVGYKTYELSNHLGNVLATITDRKVPNVSGTSFTYYNPQITTITDYYPFGMQIEERSWVASSAKYRYGFNGKEMDNEVSGDGNSLDFGARIYDSRLGRWLSLDPLMAKYPDLSAFCFTSNSPITFKDMDGRDIIIYYRDENGDRQPFKYKPGIKPIDNKFVKRAVYALDELVKVNQNFDGNTERATPSIIVGSLASNKTLTVSIVETEENSITDFDYTINKLTGIADGVISNTLKVEFNPGRGLFLLDNSIPRKKIDGDNDYISAVTILGHELKHIWDALTNPALSHMNSMAKLKDFDDKREVTAITETEWDVATFRNEGIRNNHKGESFNYVYLPQNRPSSSSTFSVGNITDKKEIIFESSSTPSLFE